MSRRGFTMIEVIVGLAMLLVLMGGAFGMLFQLQARQREIARTSALNTNGAMIVEAVERAALTCIADAGADGTGIALTDNSLRVVYRSMSPDLPTTDDAFATRARLAILHDPASAGAEVTMTHGARTQTSTLTGVERVRFRAHDGDAWTSEFDAREAGRLPAAIEVAIWFSRRNGGDATGAGRDEPGEPRVWREPDRLRVIAVFDSAAEEAPAVVDGEASGGPEDAS